MERVMDDVATLTLSNPAIGSLPDCRVRACVPSLAALDLASHFRPRTAAPNAPTSDLCMILPLT